MIRIATDLDISPETARVMADAFARMAASEDAPDDIDADEAKGLFRSLAEALAEATPIGASFAMKCGGESLNLDKIEAKGGDLVASAIRQAREVLPDARCVAVEVAVVFADEEG